MKGRLAEFDFIKGVMISLMVFGHISYVGTLQEEFKFINFLIYQFHMPVFLLMSGYFISCKNSFRQNLSKIKYIASLYLIFASSYVVLLYLLNSHGVATSNKVEEMTLFIFLKQIFLEPIGAYWYLHNLIIYYLLFFAARYVFPDNHKKFLILMGIIAIVLLFYGNYVGFKYPSSVFLFLGTFFKIKRIKFLQGFWLLIPFVLISISQCIAFDPSQIYTSSYKYIIYQLPISLILTISIIGSLISISNKFAKSRVNSLFCFTGINSLSILLFHVYFINLFQMFEQFFINLDSSGLVYVLTVTIGSLMLSILFAWGLDLFKVNQFILGGNTIFQKAPT
jgi:fucose 4-O-acetylase-like acetyltransferase